MAQSRRAPSWLFEATSTSGGQTVARSLTRTRMGRCIPRAGLPMRSLPCMNVAWVLGTKRSTPTPL